MRHLADSLLHLTYLLGEHCRHEEAKRVRPADLEEAAVLVGDAACAGGAEDR